jgi:outer membrane biogenesis lipoprotein LolB
MRPSLLPVFTALAILCACASSWDQGWVKPGASAADFERERRECLQRSAVGKGAGQFGYDQPDQQLFESCMQQRGWQREPSK